MTAAVTDGKVVVVIGAGSIGIAIARRIGAGKRILLADLRQEAAGAAAKLLSDAGFMVSTATVDVSKRASVEALAGIATGFGEVTGLIHAAGVSPSEAPAATILAVDFTARLWCSKRSVASSPRGAPEW